MNKSSLFLSSLTVLLSITLLQGSLSAFPQSLESEPEELKELAKETVYLQTMLGAEFEAISFDQAQKIGLMGGVMIKKIYSGPLSQQSFMKEGFIITKVNDEEVFTIRRLYNVLKKNPARIRFEGKYNDLLMEYDSFNGNYTYQLVQGENW